MTPEELATRQSLEIIFSAAMRCQAWICAGMARHGVATHTSARR